MSRGRHAETPTEIPAKGWKDIALRVKDEIAADHVGLIAAGVAFYALLALFPAITALLAIGGLLLEPSQIVTQLDTVTQVIPENGAEIILSQAEKVAGSQEAGLGLAAVLGIVLALYSTSKGVGSLIEGLNVAYDEEEGRGFIRLKLITFGLTVLVVLGVVAAVGLMTVIPAIAGFAESLGPVVTWAITGASWLFMLLLLMVGLAVFYRFGPDRDEPEWLWASPGAVIACLTWLVASIGFAFYVTNFGSYNESFGSLGGVIVLLMWLWISAFVVLMGAELNAEMEAQTRHDTTVGPDEPMGERGAQKADKLGESAR